MGEDYEKGTNPSTDRRTNAIDNGCCRREMSQSLQNDRHFLAVEPGFSVLAEAGSPQHCRLRGVVNRAIRVEVRMPTQDWNGRIMFSAVGGGAGSIGDTTSLLSRGFAMASTDTGHEGQTMEFMSQPEATIDYAYRGVHLATLFTKAVVEQYYGKPINYSYLNGCSNGGRAALMEAIRFPNDYDGIIAGAPSWRGAARG